MPLALYRLYRPSDFKNFVGQDAIRKTIQNELKSEHLGHALLFCGPRGTGKTSLARLVAKSLNCLQRQADGEACNLCVRCEEMNAGHALDVIEIDAASHTGVDEVREVIIEKADFAPTVARAKVYIIDEVHMLSKSAFNALLKTLEEPPDFAYFILATTDPHKIIETILSRCQRFDFRKIPDEVIAERLKLVAEKEKIQTDEKALRLIARLARGGLRDALVILEQLNENGRITDRKSVV